MAKVAEVSPQRLSIGVLTVSDTRTEENDTSGDYLIQALEAQKHRAVARSIVPDDVYQIRATLSAWIADANIDGSVGDGWHRILRTGFYTRGCATPF